MDVLGVFFSASGGPTKKTKCFEFWLSPRSACPASRPIRGRRRMKLKRRQAARRRSDEKTRKNRKEAPKIVDGGGARKLRRGPKYHFSRFRGAR